MGKNKGRHGKRTEYARFKSIMVRLDNELKKEIAEQKKTGNKKQKGRNYESGRY